MAKINTMTPDEMASKITPELLEESCQQIQSDLIQMPITVMADQTGKYVTIIPGVRNQLTFGELEGDAQLAPWSKNNHDEADADIIGRTLVVYPGNCAKGFDPMPYFHSIYGQSIALGQSMTANTIARKVATLLAVKCAMHIDEAVFDAKRNVNGKTTKDLFNGIDTIIAQEIDGGGIAAAKGNYIKLGAINNTNAVDMLKEFYRAADKHLRQQNTFLYMSPEIYDAYVDDYQTRHGSLPYNQSFDKDTLEGSRGKCKFAVLDNMAGSNYLKLSTKPNFLVGTDINGQENKVNIAKYSSWELTFEYAGVYGTQIRTLSKEAFMVGDISAAAAG